MSRRLFASDDHSGITLIERADTMVIPLLQMQRLIASSDYTLCPPSVRFYANRTAKFSWKIEDITHLPRIIGGNSALCNSLSPPSVDRNSGEGSQRQLKTCLDQSSASEIQALLSIIGNESISEKLIIYIPEYQ